MERNSEWTIRAPNAGIDAEDYLRNAYAKETARFQEGEAALGSWLDSLINTSVMAGGGSGAGRMGQSARGGLQQRQYDVGGVDDTMAAFDQEIDQADRILELMRKVWEAQQPGFKDHLKQSTIQYGPMLLGL